MDRGASRGPYRSRAFLAWAKQFAAPCAICRENPGIELHHYGPRGMSQKGSDLIVVHVCRECHGKIQGLTLGSGRWALAGRLAELADLQADTIALLAGYVQALEADPKRPCSLERPPRCAGCGHLGADGCGARWPHLEPPIDCAREELFGWAVEHLNEEDPSAQIAWLLAWANRRAANVLERLVDGLQTVVGEAAASDQDEPCERPFQRLRGRIRDMGSAAAETLRRAGFPVLKEDT